jgi:hypothetical protein
MRWSSSNDLILMAGFVTVATLLQLSEIDYKLAKNFLGLLPPGSLLAAIEDQQDLGCSTNSYSSQSAGEQE